VTFLRTAGFAVLSEESGLHGDPEATTVVVDPLDGSDNAVRGTGPFGVSLCAVDRDGPAAAVVLDLLGGSCYTAVRGMGATCDGARIEVTACTDPREALIALSGHPPRPLLSKTRSWGAAALELCAVAEGTFDGFVHCGPDHHGCWDYLAGVLICTEAGACAVDVHGRDLVCLEHAGRRAPLVAATAELAAGIRDQVVPAPLG
jgi:fructose-1,6-bisphosphatase/inositol monophosphatase family enzyme